MVILATRLSLFFRICILACFILKKSYQRSFDHGINENVTEQYFFLETYHTEFMYYKVCASIKRPPPLLKVNIAESWHLVDLHLKVLILSPGVINYITFFRIIFVPFVFRN